MISRPYPLYTIHSLLLPLTDDTLLQTPYCQSLLELIESPLLIVSEGVLLMTDSLDDSQCEPLSPLKIIPSFNPHLYLRFPIPFCYWHSYTID